MSYTEKVPAEKTQTAQLMPEGAMRSFTPPSFGFANDPSPAGGNGNPERRLEVTDYTVVAQEIHAAIAEAAHDAMKVNLALAKLDQNPLAIQNLCAVYQQQYGADLRTVLSAEFEGRELSHVMTLMAQGRGPSEERPAVQLDLPVMVNALKKAIGGEKPNVDMVLMVLVKLDNAPGLIAAFKEAYTAATLGDVVADLGAALEGDALAHAMQLLNDHSGMERLNVQNEEEALEAKAIIADIRARYGIEVNSDAGVAALKAHYTKVPKEILDQVKASAWEIADLRGLQAALAHYAPILGARREESSLAGTEQGVKTASKIDKALNENEPTAKFDATTNAESFEEANNISMYTSGGDGKGSANNGGPFDSNAQSIEGHWIHEAAHRLMGYGLGGYMKATGYWDGIGSISDNNDAENPVTSYGNGSAKEDLSEAVKFYFFRKEFLAANHPRRFQFIDQMIKSWTPEK